MRKNRMNSFFFFYETLFIVPSTIISTVSKNRGITFEITGIKIPSNRFKTEVETSIAFYVCICNTLSYDQLIVSLVLF